MNTSVVFSILCISLLLSTTGCGTQDIAPPVPVPAAPPCELDRGESTALTVNGAEGATSLEWSASSGQLTPSQGPSVTFTAPRNYSGPVVITVIARRGNAQSQGQMTCTVLAPPPTPTHTVGPHAHRRTLHLRADQPVLRRSRGAGHRADAAAAGTLRRDGNHAAGHHLVRLGRALLRLRDRLGGCGHVRLHPAGRALGGRRQETGGRR